MENTTTVERKEIHVSILGSCVSRDAFSLSKNAADYRDTVVDYVAARYVAAATVRRRRQETSSLSDCTAVGTYTRNGVTLTVHPTESFSVSGRATADTVFYLASKAKDPCGGWAPMPTSLAEGLYRFTVGVDATQNNFCQLILSYEDGTQKWYTVDAACTVRVLAPPLRRFSFA